MRFFPRIVFHLAATSVIFWGVEKFVFPTTFLVEGGLISFPIIAFVFGTLNFFIKPILKILTFPVHFITLGLSSIVLNAGLLYIWEHAINFVEFSGVQIEIKDIPTYFFIGIIFAVSNAILHWFSR